MNVGLCLVAVLVITTLLIGHPGELVKFILPSTAVSYIVLLYSYNLYNDRPQPPPLTLCTSIDIDAVTSCLVFLTVVMTVVDILGCMYYWGLVIDNVSVIQTVIAIGKRAKS